jgi:hypothetical protein
LEHLSPPWWLEMAISALFSHEITLFATLEEVFRGVKARA